MKDIEKNKCDKYRCLMKINLTIANINRIFSQELSDETLYSLQIFFKKKSLRKIEYKYSGYKLFAYECVFNLDYYKRQFATKDLIRELGRIWQNDLTEQQRKVYCQKAHLINYIRGEEKMKTSYDDDSDTLLERMYNEKMNKDEDYGNYTEENEDDNSHQENFRQIQNRVKYSKMNSDLL
ncbi:hypothetical protein COBT_001274 [Conglomerata obtusa]